MTTPDPSGALSADSDLESSLVTQLIQEAYAASTGRTRLASLDPGVSRGAYPDHASPLDAPVHPGVPRHEGTALDTGTDSPGNPTRSGAHSADSLNSHAFGEPRCYRADRHHGAVLPASTDPGHPSHAPSRSGLFPGSLSGEEFYFLPGARSGPAPEHPAPDLRGRTAPTPCFDVESVRRDFPALHQTVNGRQLIWLDNAATTHKPKSVTDATSSFYARDNSNIHRAAHTLAARATELYEGGREKVRQFLGAADSREIVFVRGTTEAINLVAQTYGRKFIGEGDEILLTTMEHHANIVPWQLLAEQTGAIIRVTPINDRGELLLDHFATLLGPHTKLVSVTHVANALGTVNPIEQIIALAHAYGVPVLVDGAQSTPHLPVNVQALDADFFAFSGHKIFGPTGIGALYAKAQWLEQLPPWQGGGNMIRDVTFAKTAYQDYPQKFEAGTQDIAGVVGLGAAIDYLLNLGLPAIAAYEHSLLEYATGALAEVPGLRPIGTAHHKASVLSFVLDGLAPEDVGKHLDRHGIAVRSGHHCAQPALRRFGLQSTVRPSLAFYNTREEIDALVRALQLIRQR